MKSTTPFFFFEENADMTSNLVERAVTILHKSSQQTLLLSGGTSPCDFYSALGKENLPWDKVNIALVDERWVNEDDTGSNAALVKRSLMSGAATEAHFTPMKTAALSPHQAAAEVDILYRALPQPTLCILGMGPDTHTASWFAEAPEYEIVSCAENPNLVAGLQAPKTSVTGKYQQRMTITGSMLNLCLNAFLVIKGDSKIALLKTALSEPSINSPIGRAAAILGPKLTIFALRGEG